MGNCVLGFLSLSLCLVLKIGGLFRLRTERVRVSSEREGGDVNQIVVSEGECGRRGDRL